jgi:hypothetical protein
MLRNKGGARRGVPQRSCVVIPSKVNSTGDIMAPQKKEPGICVVRNCDRPRRSVRGLCQTHDRQLTTKGEIQPIRPYRKRSPDTLKFSGLRLSPWCVEVLQRKVKREGLSDGAGELAKKK